MLVLLGLLCFLPGLVQGLKAQTSLPSGERRELKALRVTDPPHIDGQLDEAVWQQAEGTSGFFQYEPNNDRPASLDTEVRVLYDDHNLYIGARLLDPEPGRILAEMGLRDESNLNADSFWIEINPFDDGIYGFSFKVSASGVQGDANISPGAGSSQSNDPSKMGEDRNWDTVWKSAVRLTQDGWQAEIRIPYSALRFPKREVQQWGINFWREIRRSRETSSWNPVDRSLGNKVGSLGMLTGISGVRPHLRLAFYPYVSTYLEKQGQGRDWSGTFNGGMDIKYGINESFTLDAILIPDFGQVQSDALELNLSPYEIKYDERRQFFTESTELFNKADLFYSRRIGGRPYGYDGLSDGMKETETILANPQETRLINAVKVSGRTAGGLGIGIFNALTAAARARVLDSETGMEREIVTQPFSTYTLLVLDQSLKNNSFISLVNASVLGLAEGYTSNVTGTEFRFLDRSRSYRLSGSAALSQQYFREGEDLLGHKYSLNLGRYAGTWQYEYARSLVSDTYHGNDLGYLRRTDEVSDTLSLSHNVYAPFWLFNTMSHSLSISRSGLFSTGQLASLTLAYNMRLLFRDRFMLSLNLSLTPDGERDFYEPRVSGRFFETRNNYELSVRISSNYRNPVYLDGSFSYAKASLVEGQGNTALTLTPTFRISDRLKLSVGLGVGQDRNRVGYVRHLDDETVHFGRRNGWTLVPVLKGTFMFSNDLSMVLNVRHYWSKVAYSADYFLLGDAGELIPSTAIAPAPDINYNSFTLDAQLTWNFAPGSQLSLVWKNAIDSYHDRVIHGYFDNARFFLDQPQVNSISLKILYYLDHRSITGR
jgi:hypothetical protein